MFTGPRTEIADLLDRVGGGLVLAAETAVGYDTEPMPAANEPRSEVRPVAAGRVSTRVRLDEFADLADERDRRMARMVALLVGLLDAEDLAEVCGGMSLHVWLQHTARATHAEARELIGTAEILRDLPITATGLADGWLSWSQVTAIATAARTVPVVRRGELDGLIGDAMVAHRDWEPGALVADVWDWVDRNQPSRLERAEAAAERDQFLTLTPRLFGGGSIYGEFDPVGFATVAEALDAPLGPPVAPPDDLDDVEAVEDVFDELDAQRRKLTKQHGKQLAERMIDVCEQSLAGRAGDGTSKPARPLLLATVDLHALLDETRTPGWLLTTLAGGRMKVSTATLQRLVDERGADLRTVVLDDCGQAVGVGRKTDVPPQWLREAMWAQNLAVRDPDGTTPIRRADLDHAIPWDDDGRTDGDNLGPLGRTWHNSKTSKDWTVHHARDGTTTWRHDRHGWTIRLAPPRRDLTNPPDPPDPGPPRLPLDDLPEPAPT